MTGLTVLKVAETGGEGTGVPVVYTVTTSNPNPPPAELEWVVNESQFRTLSTGLGKIGKTDIATDPEDSTKAIGVAVNA